MRNSFAFFIFLSALLAVSTASNARPIQDYPEALAYRNCVVAKAKLYAKERDPIFDLAFTAVGACRVLRNAMEDALRADNRRGLVDEFMRLNSRTMIEIASEVIVETRRRLRH